MPRRSALVPLLLAAALRAQALPDPHVLLPDPCQIYCRVDVAKVRESVLGQSVLRVAPIKVFLEKEMKKRLAVDVEEIGSLQFGAWDDASPDVISLYMTGTAALKAAAIAEACRWAGGYEEETVAGRHGWFLAERNHGPSLVEFGPGMVWMVSPATFARERLEALRRPDAPTTDAAMKALLARAGGEVFLATSAPSKLLIVCDIMSRAQGAEATAFWLCADLQPQPWLRASLRVADKAQAEKVRAAAAAWLAQAAEHATERRQAHVAKALQGVALTVDGDEVRAGLKLENGKVDALVQSLVLLLLSGAQGRHDGPAAVPAAEIEPAVDEVAPVGRPAGSQPASQPAEKK